MSVEDRSDEPTIITLAAGSQLGPYRIEAPLGRGGMGEIYRAMDTRLGRSVALKLLPLDVSGDPAALERFKREARAASALNHPNICTVFDIGEDAGCRFIVLELLEGQTLRERIAAGPLALGELQQITIQITHALEAAHGKHIIHRDIKPANIFITKSGLVKILDFGIAKYIGEAASPGTDAFTMLTQTRGFAGTPAYASPEQVRGEALDGRSDLFSLGLVLYEMATGQLPCPGASLGDLLRRNTATRFEPPSQVHSGLPSDFDATVLRLLETDPARRFQTANELRDRLMKLQQPSRAARRVVVAVVFVVLIAALGLRFALPRHDALQSVAAEYTRLTNFPDSVHSPALSKDGKSLVFVRGRDPFLFEPGEIYLKVLPEGQPVALTHDGTPKMAPVFSPDGSRIVYTVSEDWSSFSIPVAGGAPTLFMPNAAGLRWVSPGRLLFSELRMSVHMGLVTASENRGEPRDVYFPASPNGMVHFSEVSPDQKWVLAVEMEIPNSWRPCRLLPFEGSSSGMPVGPSGSPCTAAAWSPDGRWMYFAAESQGESHLWRQAFPHGVPEQITSGLNQERGITVDPDGHSLITSVGAAQSTVWYHDETGDRPVSVEGYAYRPLVSPDGTKVFYLVRRAAKRAWWVGELWAVDLASGRNEQVLPDFLIRYFHLSHDGKYIVFDAFDKSQRSRIWIATADRSQPPRQLTPDGDVEEQRPLFGASGDIYFMREDSQGPHLYRMKLDGSAPQKLSSDPIAFLVNISPDEKHAVIWRPSGGGALLLPLAGGNPATLCSCSVGPIFQDSPRVAWSGDNTQLFVTGNATLAPAAAGPTGFTTTVIPWQGVEAFSSASLAGDGARQIPETSVAPGPTGTRYAFARTAEQSNLYRIRLP